MTEEQHEDVGTLKPDEYHPAADSAMKWIKNYQISNFERWAMHSHFKLLFIM